MGFVRAIVSERCRASRARASPLDVLASSISRPSGPLYGTSFNIINTVTQCLIQFGHSTALLGNPMPAPTPMASHWPNRLWVTHSSPALPQSESRLNSILKSFSTLLRLTGNRHKHANLKNCSSTLNGFVANAGSDPSLPPGIASSLGLAPLPCLSGLGPLIIN